jgi:hypothetical protein
LWSGDGKRLSTLTEDDYLQVWDLATGEPLTPPRKVRDFGPAAKPDETLPRDDHPVADLVLLSQMLALGRIDEKGSLVPLELKELKRDWDLLHKRFPAQFIANDSELAAWHKLQANECEVEGNLRGALFHVHQALKLRPADSLLASNQIALGAAIEGKLSSTRNPTSKPTNIPPRDPQTGPGQVDLSAHYNLSLYDSLGQKPDANNLAGLPKGFVTLGGVRFDVRGLIHLDGQSIKNAGAVYPDSVNKIQVGRTCQRLHFLQAASWSADNGTQIGSYVLHYADGQQRTLPIAFGLDTENWWCSGPLPMARQPNPNGAVVVWSGINAVAAQNSSAIQLLKSTRENPRPNVRLDSIDFISTMSPAAPFLVALTVE